MATHTTTPSAPTLLKGATRLRVNLAGSAAYQVAALTLLGLLLRRYHLGDESLWFDEADIVQRAGSDLPALLRGFTQAGENGPLYTLILHYWLAFIEAFPPLERLLQVLFGASYEGPVRGLAMLFGAAAIPLMYLLGRKLGGHRLGITGGVLLTISPFHIWHSQDAKMYSLLVLTTLLSTFLYILAWERNRTALWLAYVAATWVMLTVHGLAGLVLLAHLAATPFLARRRAHPTGEQLGTNITPVRKRSVWIGWGWAVLLILTPLFPIVWLRLAALVTGTADLGGWYSPAALQDILGTVGVTFAVNRAPQPWEAIAAITMALLAVGGVWVLFSRRGRTLGLGGPGYSALLMALLVIPLSVFWLVTLKVPLFQARYLIMALPFYLLLVSSGLLALAALPRPLNVTSWLLASLVGICSFAALSGVNYSPQPQKEDWRGAMVYISDHLRLRDEIVVLPGYLASAVDVYHMPGGPGRVPNIRIKPVPGLGIENFRERELENSLRNIVKCHERAWLVTSPIRQEQEDPENLVEEWFTGNWQTFDRKEFNGVTVIGISFNGQPDCWYPAPTVRERHSFGNGLALIGYIYEIRADATEQPDASHLPLTLYWRTDRKLLVDYTVHVRIRDGGGQVVAESALGTLNGYWPTNAWPPNNQVIDYRDIRLPGGLAAGDYQVTLQLYPKGAPDRPLTLPDGSTEVVLRQPLRVVPWTP